MVNDPTPSRLALGRVQVGGKSNEITAVPELLDVLHLKGCIVTLDAMGCQKEIAAQIAGKKADYVLALKKNHPTVFEEVKLFFADAAAPCADLADGPKGMTFHKTVDKGHGRLETRRY